MLRPNPLAVPRGLRIVEMKDRERGTSYLLAFSEQHSDYESWITNLGGPDENARLLMQLLRGGGTLVDVGANIGTISAPVAASGSAVIAIEMNPTNCLKLWAVATANGFKDFHIVQAAASDYDGMITFQGDEAWGNVYADEHGKPAVCLRLDTVLTRFDLAGPVVLKVDVEGHETCVLRGATATLNKLRPMVLFEAIEIEGAPSYAARESKLVMEKAGYQLFLQRGNVLSPKTALDIQEGHVTDFLGVPPERRSELHMLGADIRPLTDDERIQWVTEMAAFQMENHQRHAAGVFLRWGRESPHLCKKGQAILRTLLGLDHIRDLHDDLRRLAVKG